MTTTRRESSGSATLPPLLPCLLLGLVASCTSERPTPTPLQQLQGTWEGYALDRKKPAGPYVRSKPDEKITITITGNSLRFYRNPDFWWETTFTLPAGKDPLQLHATIQRPEESAGEGVVALFKIEGGTFTLAGIRDKDSTAEWPKSIEDSVDTMAGRYELRKVRPEKKRKGD